MTVACPEAFIDLASRLADAAGAVIRRYFRSRCAVDDKRDRTPVTAADRGAEEAMRAILAAERPGDGIYGEEFGAAGLDSELVWVIDPIDGTKAFITGRPTFGTLIALLRDGVPILGVIDQPVLGERWVGAVGRPTTWNGAPTAVRACPSLAAALVSATTPDMFRGNDRPGFERVARRAKTMLYGGDCYAYGLLAAGFQDAVIEADLKIYDFAALGPILAGAGGVVTDWQGRPLRLGSDGRLFAAGDERVHREALALLAGDEMGIA